MPHSPTERSLVASVLPLHLGRSDIVVEDDLGHENPLEVTDYTCTNRELVNLENASVNIDNSNDVIIGPVTQFNVNGNVTIFQNEQQEATTEKGYKGEEGDDNGLVPQKGSKQLQKVKPPIKNWLDQLMWLLFVYRKLIKNLSIALGVFLIALTVTLILVDKVINADVFEDNYEDPYYGDHIGEHKVYYRKDWGGLPPKKHTLLEHPADLIIISHSSTRFCKTFQTCADKVKKLQNLHQSFAPDICYNFIIGGDGDIYVGTGWDVQNYHRRRNSSIGINYIGDFNYDKLTTDMINATLLLIAQGIGLHKISDDYLIVGENQTYSKTYLSPGENAYKYWMHSPQFYNRTMF